MMFCCQTGRVGLSMAAGRPALQDLSHLPSTYQLEAGIAAQEALRPTLGDAVVGATIAALRAQLEALRTGHGAATSPPGPTGPDPLFEQLQSYLPQGLADKMRATARIEGKRRQVTVLFADISGFTALSERLEPEEVVNLSNAVLRELAEAVYGYEGHVDKFLGDAVMAVFGAPVAHEDDAERALRCALDMRQRLDQLSRRWIESRGQPLALHVGVNTGKVIAGSVSSDLRMSYTVMGDTVNTASRLEDASGPGQILVSRDTYRLVREAFTFLALAPGRVKGKRQPLAVYELLRARLDPRKARGLRDLAPAFVGREQSIGLADDIVGSLFEHGGNCFGASWVAWDRLEHHSALWYCLPLSDLRPAVPKCSSTTLIGDDD